MARSSSNKAPQLLEPTDVPLQALLLLATIVAMLEVVASGDVARHLTHLQLLILRLHAAAKSPKAVREDVQEVLQELVQGMVGQADEDYGLATASLVEHLPKQLHGLHSDVRLPSSRWALDEGHCVQKNVPQCISL
jgi:hypothetical protein